MQKIFFISLVLLYFQPIHAQEAKDTTFQESDLEEGKRKGGRSGLRAVGNLLRNFSEEIFKRNRPVSKTKLFRRKMRQQRIDLRNEKREKGLLNPKYGLELHFDFGGVPNTYQTYRPRLRGRIGIVSTDLRYSFLIEQRLGEQVNRLHTFDWQILQLTPINTPMLSWRLGMGMTKELETNEVYPELATGLDVYFNRQRVRFAPEVRFVWSEGSAIRDEINGELSYAVWYAPKAKLYLGLTGLYARYFGEIDIWSVGLGLHLKLD